MIEQCTVTLLKEICGLRKKCIKFWDIKGASPVWQSFR